MPAKSRHGKGKRSQNKNRARQPQTAQAVQTANAPAAVGAAPVKTPSPVKSSGSKVVSYTPASTSEYPFFTSELKRITVITGIIVVVLVILAFIIR
jgi:hypothetical protein